MREEEQAMREEVQAMREEVQAMREEVATWRRRKDAAEREKAAAHVRAKEAEALAHRTRNELHDRLNQPDRVDGCTKVQFHQQDEAREWLLKIATEAGEDPGQYRTYDCKICPRSPVTMRRYWHVGHRGSEQAQASKAATRRQREADRAAARRQGNLLRQRVDPATVAKLLALKKEDR
jgi:hypothetical protein